jgi:hypothetical protein
VSTGVPEHVPTGKTGKSIGTADTAPIGTADTQPVAVPPKPDAGLGNADTQPVTVPKPDADVGHAKTLKPGEVVTGHEPTQPHPAPGPELVKMESGSGSKSPDKPAGGPVGVLAETRTPDGARIKALSDGRSVICRSCVIVDLANEFATELANPLHKDLKADVEAAKTLEPAAKIEAEAALRAKLTAIKSGTVSPVGGDSGQPKTLVELGVETHTAIAEATRLLEANPTLKGPFGAELRQIVADHEPIKKEAGVTDETLQQAAKDLFTPVHARAIDLVKNINDALQPKATGVKPEIVDKATHIEPKDYSRGKHVQGTTEAQRQSNSAEGGPGQFSVELTAEQVKALERETLMNPDSIEQREDGGYHAFKTFETPIGYADGEESHTLRAELSGGSVHSHPRPDSENK